jgi:general stress protein 26
MDDLLQGLLQKLSEAEALWFGSVRPDGRPHLAPIWHIWHDDAAWMVTKASAVRTRNLASNPQVSLALPDPMNPLILEGNASEAPHALATLQPLFQRKYDWDIATDADYTVILRVEPAKLMAWGNHGEGRWRYTKDGWEAIARA